MFGHVFLLCGRCVDERLLAGPLTSAPNIIHTPHSAWFSDTSCKDLRLSAAREVRRAIVGRCPHDLTNCVNKEALLAAHSRRPTSTSATPSVSTSFNPLAAAVPSFGTSIADGQFSVFLVLFASYIRQLSQVSIRGLHVLRFLDKNKRSAIWRKIDRVFQLRED